MTDHAIQLWKTRFLSHWEHAVSCSRSGDKKGAAKWANEAKAQWKTAKVVLNKKQRQVLAGQLNSSMVSSCAQPGVKLKPLCL
jgi:hypothetical protein